MKASRLLTCLLLVGCSLTISFAQDGPSLAQMTARAEQSLVRDPENPALMLDLAKLRAHNGDRQAALALLQKVVAKQTGMDPLGGLGRFNDDPEFRDLVSRIHRDFPPVTTGELAFTIAETDLVPEGIAYDATSGRFFVSSIYKHKIVAIGRDHSASDFVASSADGLNVPLGLRVDSARRLLWAACEFRVAGEGGRGIVTRSGVAAYELATGRLARRVLMDGPGHQPNDLVVTKPGDVYVTDSRSNELYRLPEGGTRLERVLDSSQIDRPNGIALSPDESRLFIAAWPSIVALNIHTKKITPLRHSIDIVTGGVDGLYFHNSSLVGVQNDVHPGRVVRFELSADLTTVERVRVLEAYNPRFDIPTTGAIANGSVYVIANSQLEQLAGDKLRVPASRMNPTTILRVPLRW